MKRLIILSIVVMFTACKKSGDGCWHCKGSDGSSKVSCSDTSGVSFDQNVNGVVVHYECEKH